LKRAKEVCDSEATCKMFGHFFDKPHFSYFFSCPEGSVVIKSGDNWALYIKESKSRSTNMLNLVDGIQV
jgi:hypothetical protein